MGTSCDTGRLITTTLPSGVTEARSYNAADQLTSILAKQGANTLTSFMCLILLIGPFRAAGPAHLR